MTKDMQIKGIVEDVPFADLFLSELNPRQIVNEEGIAALADNIRQLGLIQNLAGLREDGGKVGIVAGGRRLRALALLQDEVRFQTVTVRIAPDAATAKLWATSENHHREQPHPADEIREYSRLAEEGYPPASIAVAFGVTEKHVYRRLALATLPGPVLDALRVGEISLGMAACFTICDDEARALAVLDQCRGAAWSDHNLKRALKPDTIEGSDRRAVFVGKEAYVQAGGKLGGDLFAEVDHFDSPDILDALFLAKLEAEAEALRQAEGWAWAETCTDSFFGWHRIEEMKCARLYAEPGVLSETESARYDDLADLSEAGELDADAEAELERLQSVLDGEFSAAQKAVAGIVTHVERDGTLRVTRGLVKPDDKRAAITSGVLQASRHEGRDETPKSPISAKLAEDLARVTRGARQNAVLDHPDLLLDLLAFQLVGKLGYRQVLGLRTDDVPNQPGTETGYRLDERLTTPVPGPKDMWEADFAASFRAYRKKGADHLRADLIRHLAALLSVGDEKMARLIDKEAGTDIRAVWTPTAENFFGRVKGSYLDSLWRALLDLDADHPTATTFSKLKTKEKAAKLEALFNEADTRAALSLTPEQLTRIAAWLPEGMA